MVKTEAAQNKLEVRIDRMGFVGAETSLIRKLSLKVGTGEIVGLLGPSGIGKTTLLRIIAGLENRYDGEVIVDGNVKRGPGSNVQLVFQECRLLPWMTARDNVLFAFREPYDDVVRRAADRALQDVGLAGKEERWPRDLSGGEIARVAFARAIAGRPSVLLMDEPFANVDVKVKSDLQSLVICAARELGVGVMFVTHSIEDAICLSDRVCVAKSTPLGTFKTYRVDVEHPRSLFSSSLRDVLMEIEQDLREA